jgi:hypothetical protein
MMGEYSNGGNAKSALDASADVYFAAEILRRRTNRIPDPYTLDRYGPLFRQSVLRLLLVRLPKTN